MRIRRPTIARSVKDAVLKEFNHRCAVCSADKPHIHHIDEDPQNNDPLNLIPLCPNCHLSDQHDASNAIPIAKLRFFRQYKHRNILKPQFNAVFRRLEFLENPSASEMSVLRERVSELCAFIEHLPMGGFYARKIGGLLATGRQMFFPTESKEVSEQHARDELKKYVQVVERARSSVERLIVELLDFQTWTTTEDPKHAGR